MKHSKTRRWCKPAHDGGLRIVSKTRISREIGTYTSMLTVFNKMFVNCYEVLITS